MKDDIIIEGEGITITMRPHVYKWDGDLRDRRQYYRQETNVHVHIKDESVIDNMKNRRQRPYTTWKKELLPVVARMIERETGMVMDPKRSWDQKLGCSCPCSPGFRTKMRDETGAVVPYTVWVAV